MLQVIKVGNIVGGGQSQGGNTYLPEGISPTLLSGMSHGNVMPFIVEVKFMNDNIKVLGKLDSSYDQSARIYNSNGISPTIMSNAHIGGYIPIKCVEIKQATESGYVECDLPGIADLCYANSTTRRGRVQGRGQICPALATENVPNVLEPWVWEIDGIRYLIRIRKLTPLECWRLMDFTDEDFHKAEAVNSNTQLYKQAGNSIVKNVLCEVFKQMM